MITIGGLTFKAHNIIYLLFGVRLKTDKKMSWKLYNNVRGIRIDFGPIANDFVYMYGWLESPRELRRSHCM